MAYTLTFAEVGSDDLPLVGGKGANLGELTRAGLPVPPGFCVTTAAFTAFMSDAEEPLSMLDGLDDPEDLTSIRAAGERLRARLGDISMPDEVTTAIVAAWEAQGTERPYAVRSSATAEDLPDASFAGQQDTYLNVIGREDILDGVRRCWISLYTDRAIQYRIKHSFDHQEVLLSVVVQRMVLPDVAGIMFTADPISGHRHVVSIDAGFGLGEALVSGLVSADLYKYDKSSGTLLDKTIADKHMMIKPLPGGGTEEIELSETQRHAQVLDDDAIKSLAAVGLQIERHYGQPQDIEWCIEDGECFVVQSRPVTTLYPLVDPAPRDGRLHAYFCFNHIQGMTDPIPDMGRDLIRMVYPYGKDGQTRSHTAYLVAAGGRLYHDGTEILQLYTVSRRFPSLLENSDPLMGRALAEVVARDAFDSGTKSERVWMAWAVWRRLIPTLLRSLRFMFLVDPAGQVSRRATTCDNNIQIWTDRLDEAESGPEKTRIIKEMMGDVYAMALALWIPMIFAAMLSMTWLRKLHPEAGDDVDALLRAMPNNVTTEKDLEITDLAESIRNHPNLIRRLRANPPEALPTVLENVKGGPEFLRGLHDWMASYGARAPSEIDISRPRYSESPATIIEAIIAALDDEPGAARSKHRQLAGEAIQARERLLGPGGWLKTRLTERLSQVGRLLMAAREQPKFYGVRCLALARKHLLLLGERLVGEGKLEKPEDVWFLTLDDLLTDDVDVSMVPQRAEQHRRFAKLFPPRVMTSDGENVIVFHSAEGMPEGALVGVSASGGVVEGPARVIHDPAGANLTKGDILVAPFTDPGWTPLFAQAGGLVMEVGGQMTHGSVVAREYGIPAVVCVPQATTRIVDGQRIRVNGDMGYIEILEGP